MMLLWQACSPSSMTESEYRKDLGMVFWGGELFREVDDSDIGDYGVSCGSNKAILRGSVTGDNGQKKEQKSMNKDERKASLEIARV
ncbi:hypothetical protein L195_g049683 [Trifolium pratense]|uniref:Uncharacterized protein n=1 Tax=Trifolium pratense TaxID=57577 RepID=A0A2K3JPX5_TRIPR|nr:hypothetical protein L195_g049683 [Trifolium pratense]